MKGRLLVAGVAVALLAGCTTPRYEMVKPGASQETITQEDAKCQNAAAQVQFADFEYRGTFMEGANIQMKQQKAYQNCMIGKGYSTVRMN